MCDLCKLTFPMMNLSLKPMLGGDSGLPDSPRSDGANCIPQIFAWLAEFIGNEEGRVFVPAEWKLRTRAGRLQNLWRGDCGVYTVTHVMALAFGYGYGEGLGAFPREHQARIIKRRKRYVQDLMFGGFKLYEEGSPNCEYFTYDGILCPIADSNYSAILSTHRTKYPILPLNVEVSLLETLTFCSGSHRGALLGSSALTYY